MSSGIRRRMNAEREKPPLVHKNKTSDQSDVHVQGSSQDSRCVQLLKVLMFVIVVPPMMNYAGLRQEREHLTRNLTVFDVGFGQKLFMSCLGEGKPTVILDAPTGSTSEVWLSGQLQLAAVTRVGDTVSSS